ncbi:GNAT family N-acetyltransferase [Chitinimonas lacunae]|uniref:GNAT family N-acetyltransferase n=1 Tax=Chitinimonas lacunae TaxID=1963018 RepID=A0ABV8MUA3_9NEIS
MSRLLYRGHHIDLRLQGPDDLPTLFEWAVDPAFAFFQPQQSWAYPTLEAMATRQQWLAHFEPPIEIGIVIEHAPSHIPIGAVLLSALDHHNGKGELSLYLARGRGTRCTWEALHAAIDGSFTLLGLDKLIFQVLADNAAAHGPLTRFSVCREGVLRGEIRGEDGQRHDVWRYGLLKTEWPTCPLADWLRRVAPLREKENPA